MNLFPVPPLGVPLVLSANPNAKQPKPYTAGQYQGPELPLTDADCDAILCGGLDWPASGDADLPAGLITSGYLPTGPDQSTTKAALPGYWIVGTDGKSVWVDPSTSSVPLGTQTLKVRDSGSAVFLPGMAPQSSADPLDRTRLYANEDEQIRTYAGSDMRVLIELPFPGGGANPGPTKRKQLIELTTVSISVHRVKSPVRASGFTNPKGFARGGRTVAGTLILTQFTVDVMYRFLYDEMVSRDLSKDSFYLKPDQLPPFDMTLLFSDEYGNASYRRLLGVDCATDGTVYSVNDMFTEQTISYYAADFTPLLPMNRTALMAPPCDTAADVQKTPMGVMPSALKPDVTSTINYDTKPATSSGFEGIL